MSCRLSLSILRSRGPWMILAALAVAAPAHGVAAAPEIRIDPTTLYFGAAPPPASASVRSSEGGLSPAARPVLSKELREKAASAGTVRVLVQLAAPFTPEGRLSDAQALEQRQTIRLAQGSALGKLAGRPVKVHARYEHIPFLALEVDADALDGLAGLAEVRSIQEDLFQQPQLASSNAVIGSGVAWAQGLTGAGQVIAVLDTGVD